MRIFQSILAPFFEDYLAHKRSLGYAFASPDHLYLFDAYYHANNYQEINITKKVFEEWSQKRPNETDSNVYKRINSIRNFLIYLNHCGYESYIPRLPKNYKSTFTPHIFNQNELNAFFDACDSRMEKRYYFQSTHHIYPALFRLLYGTGMRISEVLALKIDDVDLNEGIVTVRESKNGKQRLIPISSSLIQVLVAFKCHYREKVKANDLFFVKLDGTAVSRDTVYKNFRKVLTLAGISHGGKGQGIRVHDFRHSFSVHSLHTMANKGLDIYYCLPILSQYLGHQSIEATNGYVRIILEMYPEMMGKLNQNYAYLFPEVL